MVRGSVLAGARTSYMGIVIGRIWGGEACGQIPAQRQPKQILGGPAGGRWLILFQKEALNEVESCQRGFQLTWPFFLLHFCFMFTLDINITEHAHIGKSCSLL